jgi:hypothetical protein
VQRFLCDAVPLHLLGKKHLLVGYDRSSLDVSCGLFVLNMIVSIHAQKESDEVAVRTDTVEHTVPCCLLHLGKQRYFAKGRK